MIIVDNDAAIYGKRTDQRDLKLLCVFCYGTEIVFSKISY